MKHRACEQVGIGSVGIEIPGDATTQKVLETVTRLNEDADINGILVQHCPFPKAIDTDRVIAGVCIAKDVDGFHPTSLGLLMSGKPGFTPCTPTGIMTLLEEYNIPVAGAGRLLPGESIDVGRPMAALHQCRYNHHHLHSKTGNFPAELKRADILVSAIGKAHFITPEMVSPARS